MTEPPAWVPPVAQPVPPPIPVPLIAPPPARQPNPYAVPPRAPNPGRGPSTLVIVLIVVGVLVALIVGFVAIVGNLLSSFGSYEPPQYPVTQPEPEFTPREPTAPPPTSPTGGPGQTLTTDHGVSLTVETPSCYSFIVGGDPNTVGRRCSVPIDVVNDSLEQIKISSSDFALYFGDVRFEPDSAASEFFGVARASYLDPASAGFVLLWFDVAEDGGEPTRLEFQRRGVVDTKLTVDFAAVPPPSPASPPPGDDAAPLGTTLYATPTFSNAPGFMAVTVTEVECGLDESLEDTAASGTEYCRVTATVGNETDAPQKVSGADFTLLAAGTFFTTSSSSNRFGGERRSDFLDPGQVDECFLWFSVPRGTDPTGVRYVTYGGTTVTFTVG